MCCFRRVLFNPDYFEIFHNSVLIVRYLMVCHATFMINNEKRIGSCILKCVACTSMWLGLACIYHRDHMRMFLECMGRSEWFIMNLKNPFLPFDRGEGIALEFFNPFRLSINIIAFSFIIVVPVLYYKIFQFRAKQDSRIQGKYL